MKIGIVTITEGDNYGNRLQNYALTKKIKSMGHEVETIRNYIIYKEYSSKLWIFKQIIKFVFGKKESKFAIKRRLNFSKFDKQYFDFSKDYSTINYISPNLNEHYDCFICGSDQVWNLGYKFNLDFNFMTFADPVKRNTYAASFGISDIPENVDVLDIQAKINELNNISVREYEGEVIVKKLTEKNVITVIDPTLLLNRSEWKKIAEKPKLIKKKFILKYFLGDATAEEKIREFCNNNNYEIIDILNYKTKYYELNPANFLWLIENAELVVTDSYHATIFSIIFNTPFITMDRRDKSLSMKSRFNTLFYKLGIQQINNIDQLEHLKSYSSEEYSSIIEKLHNEQKIADDYLKRIFEEVKIEN